MNSVENGVWESTLELSPEKVSEDRTILIDIMNSLPNGVHLNEGTYVLPSGRVWRFRMLQPMVDV